MPTFTKDTLPLWPILHDRDPEAIVDRRADVAVGSVAFIDDPNSRFYAREPGDPTSRCIERYHFVARRVVGETRVSWLLEFREKVPKRGSDLYGRLDVEDALVHRVYRPQIYNALCQFDDTDPRLAEIASAIGLTTYKRGDHPATVGRAVMDSEDVDLIRRVGASLDIPQEQ